MRYRLDVAAIGEFEEAVRYYTRVDRQLGVRFVDEVFRSIGLIRVSPYLGRHVAAGIREFRVMRFPYSVLYSVDDAAQLITVESIADQRRKQRYRRFRVEEQVARYELQSLAA